MDIVDVWFESGSTHAFVLEARDLPWPADLYLEGSDQHRGWFQSSLLEAVGTRGVAPFKAVLTDGFVMDEQGRKMSKSLGNVTAPQEVADKYGVDILRLWVMMSDTTEDLRIGPEILKQQAELYRRLRNTLRWLLGSLAGFTEAERVPYAEMPELEKWVLHRLTELDARIRAVGAELRLDRRVSRAAQFLRHRSVGVLFRCAQGRDLLRSAGQPAPPRRAHRAGSSAPLPDHVARAGAVLHRRGSLVRAVRRSRQRASATVPRRCRRSGATMRWRRGGRRSARSAGASPCRSRRRGAANTLGSSLQAAVTLPLSADAEPCCWLTIEWAEIAIVSAVRDRGRTRSEPLATISPAPGDKCARCWRVLPEVGKQPAHPALCVRCTDAVESGLVCRADGMAASPPPSRKGRGRRQR